MPDTPDLSIPRDGKSASWKRYLLPFGIGTWLDLWAAFKPYVRNRLALTFGARGIPSLWARQFIPPSWWGPALLREHRKHLSSNAF